MPATPNAVLVAATPATKAGVSWRRCNYMRRNRMQDSNERTLCGNAEEHVNSQTGKSRYRPLLGAFLYMALFGLFGAPSAPFAEVLTATGGDAMADNCGYMLDCFSLPGDSDGDGIPDAFDACPFDPTNRCNDGYDNDLTPDCSPNFSTVASVMSIGFGLASIFVPALAPISAGLAIAGEATECSA